MLIGAAVRVFSTFPIVDLVSFGSDLNIFTSVFSYKLEELCSVCLDKGDHSEKLDGTVKFREGTKLPS